MRQIILYRITRKEQTVICPECEKVIDRCVECGRSFGTYHFCFNEGVEHFCSKECMSKYKNKYYSKEDKVMEER